MVSSVLIVDRKLYKVDHRKVSDSIRSSYTYTGVRWNAEIDKEKKTLTYTNDFGAVYQMTLPNDLDNPILLELMDCENLKVYHNNNKRRFDIPPGRGNYYVRLVFSHPHFIKKVQLLFRYDISMFPLSLDKSFFSGTKPIELEHNRL